MGPKTHKEYLAEFCGNPVGTFHDPRIVEGLGHKPANWDPNAKFDGHTSWLTKKHKGRKTYLDFMDASCVAGWAPLGRDGPLLPIPGEEAI